MDETTPPVPPAEEKKFDLSKYGLTLEGDLILDISRNLRGGLTTAKTPVRYLLDLRMTLESEPLLHYPGGTFFVEFQSHHGPHGSADLVGDLGGYDNIDAFSFIQIAQLWYQQTLLDKQIRIKAGKMDANADFMAIDHGGEFLNSTMSYSTTLFCMPTYPDPAPGVAVFYEPIDLFYTGAGVFYSNRTETFLDLVGNPQDIQRSEGGVFTIGEIGSRWKWPAGLAGHAAIGAWHHNGRFPMLEDETMLEAGTGGFYGMIDQTFYHQDAKEGGREIDIGGFVNYGWSDPDVAGVNQQVAGGLVSRGFLTILPEDAIGVGIGWIDPGHIPDMVYSHELMAEFFYRLQITSWAAVKADLQYIQHPSAVLDDALVATLRLEFSF